MLFSIEISLVEVNINCLAIYVGEKPWWPIQSPKEEESERLRE